MLLFSLAYEVGPNSTEQKCTWVALVNIQAFELQIAAISMNAHAAVCASHVVLCHKFLLIDDIKLRRSAHWFLSNCSSAFLL